MTTRRFENHAAYEAFYEKHERRYNNVDIVANPMRSYADADGEFTCVRWQTALKRFAKATGWDWVLWPVEEYERMKTLYPKAYMEQWLDENVFQGSLIGGCGDVALMHTGDGEDFNIWYVFARQIRKSDSESMEAVTEEEPFVEQAECAVDAEEKSVNGWSIDDGETVYCAPGLRLEEIALVIANSYESGAQITLTRPAVFAPLTGTCQGVSVNLPPLEPGLVQRTFEAFKRTAETLAALL